MPKIATYDAPIQTIHPEEKGYAAFETAGRRIGPLYNQAATDLEEAGRLTAQNLEDSGKTAQAIADLLRPPTTSGSGSSSSGARLGRIGARTGGVGGDVSSFARSAKDLAEKVDAATTNPLDSTTTAADTNRTNNTTLFQSYNPYDTTAVPKKPPPPTDTFDPVTGGSYNVNPETLSPYSGTLEKYLPTSLYNLISGSTAETE